MSSGQSYFSKDRSQIAIRTHRAERNMQHQNQAMDDQTDLHDCFQFVHLGVASEGAPWWPCLRFRNMQTLNLVAQKWNLYQDEASKRCRHTAFGNDFPNSISCPVALLLGDCHPVERYMFDTGWNKPLLQFRSFLDGSIQLSCMFGHIPSFVQAVTLEYKLEAALIRPSNDKTTADASNQTSLPGAAMLTCSTTCGARGADTDNSLHRKPCPTVIALESQAPMQASDEDRSNAGGKERKSSVPDCATTRPSTRRRGCNEVQGGSHDSRPPAPGTIYARTWCDQVDELEECPPFSMVRGILERGGYDFPLSLVDGHRCRLFVRPCGTSFSSERVLRKDLCAFGINCRCNANSSRNDGFPCKCWSEADKRVIHRWVRHDVIRGPRRGGSRNVVTRSVFLDIVDLLGCSHFRSSQFDGYKFPGVDVQADGVVGKTIFCDGEDMVLHLSRFGWPKWCSFSDFTADERFDMESFLATYERPTLYVPPV
jgi:hypothetical protein